MGISYRLALDKDLVFAEQKLIGNKGNKLTQFMVYFPSIYCVIPLSTHCNFDV